MPKTISRIEFVALSAMLFSTIALSIDSMLPALPEIADALAGGDTEAAALVIVTFLLGLGLGMLFAGPISDTIGRKPTLVGGAMLYCLASLVCAVTNSLEVLLFARVLQGIGASGPRVAAMAVVRDLFSGREMAQITSIIMTVFVVVPAAAPSIGAAIIAFVSWRGIFVFYVVFSIVSALWMLLRLRETLAPENRRPFRPGSLFAAVREVLTHPVARAATLAQVLSYAMLFSNLSVAQQQFEQIFDKNESFPLWYGGLALVSALGSIANARLVMRLGMLRLASWAFLSQVPLSLLIIAVSMSGVSHSVYFPLFLLWQLHVLFVVAFTIGNLNAIAMEPLGHMAGAAASVVGSVSMIGAVFLSIPATLVFDGTSVPLAVTMVCMSALGYWFITRLRANLGRN